MSLQRNGLVHQHVFLCFPWYETYWFQTYNNKTFIIIIVCVFFCVPIKAVYCIYKLVTKITTCTCTWENLVLLLSVKYIHWGIQHEVNAIYITFNLYCVVDNMCWLSTIKTFLFYLYVWFNFQVSCGVCLHSIGWWISNIDTLNYYVCFGCSPHLWI